MRCPIFSIGITPFMEIDDKGGDVGTKITKDGKLVWTWTWTKREQH